jgi:hypothetical protein
MAVENASAYPITCTANRATNVPTVNASAYRITCTANRAINVPTVTSTGPTFVANNLRNRFKSGSNLDCADCIADDFSCSNDIANSSAD